MHNERRDAAVEVSGRLRTRGIELTGSETGEELVNMLEGVERFERAVELHGGDLMVDDLKSSKPDDRHFVLPRRWKDESVAAYLGRVDDAAARLKAHPRRPD